jgi:hypothetical protein
MKFTAQQVKERYDTYKKLGTLRATAKHYDVSFQSLAMLFKYHNLPVNERGKNRLAYRQAEITNDVMMLCKKHSVKEISAMLKASENTVRCVLVTKNLKSAKKRKFSPEIEDQICTEYTKASVMELSKKFGASFPSILAILKRNGVKVRPRGAGSHKNAY